MTNRCVVLGDVVASRDIPDRQGFRERLLSAIASVNETYDETVVADFALQKGVDEFGGVLDSPVHVYDIVDELTRRVHPQEVRFAVAWGEVDVAPDASDVQRMDGPAFHRADELQQSIADTAYRFAMDLDDPPLDTTLADQINLLLLRKADWTDRQHRVVARYDELGSQGAVADELDISQPAVSQALSRANYRVLRGIEGRLRETLGRYEP